LYASALDLVLTVNSPEDMMASAGFAGATWNPSLAMVGIGVVDCLGSPVPGASVTIEPSPGTMAYVDAAGLPNETLTATTAFGIAIGYNTPTGDVAVGAVVGAVAFQANDFPALPGELTIAAIHP
jgi:hypothetical protein